MMLEGRFFVYIRISNYMKDKDGEEMFNLYVESQEIKLLREEYYDCFRDCKGEGRSDADCRAECSHMIEDDSTDNLDIDKIKSYLTDPDQQDPMFTQSVLPNVEAYLRGELDYVDVNGHMDTPLPNQQELENYLDTIKHGRVGNLARKGAGAMKTGAKNLGRAIKKFKPQFQKPIRFPGR